ncbi:MAG: hypothetical protein JSV45_14205 [Chromatiales bacterium]|nr:MAG: hypothetical protein JSV45_14205 [Chromatiales bacterium]
MLRLATARRVGALFVATGLTGVAADERLARLQPEQQVLARDYNRFVQAMDDKYFARVASLNGGAEYETLLLNNEYSDYDIRVTRGPTVEKFGRMLALGNKTSPGRGDRVLSWGRFYSLDAHPKTPLVGMLHATIVLQFFENGDASTGGWLGVMPATRVAEDLQALKALTDEHFARHDKSPDLYRRLICKGTEDTVARWRRRPACVGVSFYGPPVFPGDARQSFEFIAALFDDFVGLYIDQVEQRHGQAVTASDLQAQDTMRRQWLLDQLFSDPYSSTSVPFEAWSLANMPPEVKF